VEPDIHQGDGQADDWIIGRGTLTGGMCMETGIIGGCVATKAKCGMQRGVMSKMKEAKPHSKNAVKGLDNRRSGLLKRVFVACLMLCVGTCAGAANNSDTANDGESEKEATEATSSQLLEMKVVNEYITRLFIGRTMSFCESYQREIDDTDDMLRVVGLILSLNGSAAPAQNNEMIGTVAVMSEEQSNKTEIQDLKQLKILDQIWVLKHMFMAMLMPPVNGLEITEVKTSEIDDQFVPFVETGMNILKCRRDMREIKKKMYFELEKTHLDGGSVQQRTLNNNTLSEMDTTQTDMTKHCRNASDLIVELYTAMRWSNFGFPGIGLDWPFYTVLTSALKMLALVLEAGPMDEENQLPTLLQNTKDKLVETKVWIKVVCSQTQNIEQQVRGTSVGDCAARKAGDLQCSEVDWHRVSQRKRIYQRPARHCQIA
jgi:hypothetical protein